MFSLKFPLSFNLGFVCDAVCGSGRAEIARGYDLVGDNILWEIAGSNRIKSIIAHTLCDAVGSKNVPQRWRREYAETEIRIGTCLKELDRVSALLVQEDIPVVVLKNGGIARGGLACVGCCPMGDLDLLVRKRDFRIAHSILLNDGYQFEFRCPTERAELLEAEKGGGAEYWKVLPNGEKLWLELQWRPVAGRWIRPDQEPSAEELMVRSIPIPGTAVRILSPEDNLLQVALHTAKHTYVRAPGFRLHLDVERIVRAYSDLNWDVFLKRVKNLQVRTVVYFSLTIPKELFKTPIPERIIAELKPPYWKERLITKWLNQVELFNPHGKKFGKFAYVLFNVFLYDDLKGLLRSMFPKRDWMEERYGSLSPERLPVLYLRRLIDLALRRVNT